MIEYSFYFLLMVALAVLLTAAFRRLRRDETRIASPREDAAFERRMAAIEKELDEKRTGRPAPPR